MNIKLYAKDAKGNIRIWKIDKTYFGYSTSSGLLYGKLIQKSHFVQEGKANRTVLEQITLEMSAKVKRKVDSGFVYEIDEAITLDRTSGLGFILPMLASPTKHKSYETKNSYLQIKYNGLRCLFTKLDGTTYAYSKTGILYPIIAKQMRDINLEEGQTIDGELYHHGTHLQTINSWVKREQPETKLLKYHCYDIVSDKDFSERLKMLTTLRLGESGIVVPSWHISQVTSVKSLLNSTLEQGYEGLILRQPGFGYQDGKRNKAMLKIKVFQDGEFLITDMSASKEGWAILHCITGKGGIFKVLAPGTHQVKRDLLLNKDFVLHRYLTIEYAELSKTGIPMQPVALYFRDFE